MFFRVVKISDTLFIVRVASLLPVFSITFQSLWIQRDISDEVKFGKSLSWNEVNITIWVVNVANGMQYPMFLSSYFRLWRKGCLPSILNDSAGEEQRFIILEGNVSNYVISQERYLS